MDYLTVREAAGLLKVSHITVRRHIAAGQLRAVRVGKGIRVPLDAIDAYLRPVQRVQGEAPLRVAEPAAVYEVAPMSTRKGEEDRIMQDVYEVSGIAEQEERDHRIMQAWKESGRRDQTPEERAAEWRIIQAMFAEADEDLVRRGGRPYPNSWQMINEMRDERTRALMGDPE